MVRTYYNIFHSNEGPPKYPQSGIFGMKVNHLATLPQAGSWIDLKAFKASTFQFLKQKSFWLHDTTYLLEIYIDIGARGQFLRGLGANFAPRLTYTSRLAILRRQR
jgi:hypothetical protein